MDYHDPDQEYGHRSGMWKMLLGVLITLVALYAVVRSFYSIGQRHSVTPQEVIAEGPAKTAPKTQDGRVIASYKSSADEMISGERDVIAPLPVVRPEKADLSFDRNRLDTTLQTDIISLQEEIVDLTKLPLARSVEGEPSPKLPEVFERGAEEIVAPNALAELSRQIDIAKGANGAKRNESVEVDSALLAERTVLAKEPDQPQDHTSVPPIPEPKPKRLTLLTRPGVNGGEVLRVPPPPGTERQAPASADAPFGSTSKDDKPLLSIKIPGAEQRTLISPPPPPEITTEASRPHSALHPPQPSLQPQLQSQPRQQALAPRTALPAVPQSRPGTELAEYQVQLAALATPEMVKARWLEIKRQNMDILGRFGLEILPVTTADGRQLFRLRAGPFADKFAAGHVCETLKQRRVDCFVRRR